MSESSTRVRKAYDEWAEIYDTNSNPTRDLNARAIREESLPLFGKRILEIGCGTGLNTQYLIRYARQVVGIDISDAMLAKARQRIGNDKNVQFITGDITKPWKFETESFDMVIASLVLEHIENLSDIFSKAFHVLPIGGMFYMGELHPYKQLQQSQAKFVSNKTDEEVLVEAFIHSVSEYVNEALNAGFTLRRMREWRNDEDDIPRLLSLLFEKQSS